MSVLVLVYGLPARQVKRILQEQGLCYHCFIEAVILPGQWSVNNLKNRMRGKGFEPLNSCENGP